MRIEKVGINSVDMSKNPRGPVSADDPGIDTLAQSMSELGQLSPIIVREHLGNGQPYEHVSGARRLAAARKLGWPGVEAVILPACDEGSVTKLSQLADNENRCELTPPQRFRACLELESSGLSAQSIAQAIGASVGSVYILLRLSKLCPVLLESFLSQSPLETDEATGEKVPRKRWYVTEYESMTKYPHSEQEARWAQLWTDKRVRKAAKKRDGNRERASAPAIERAWLMRARDWIVLRSAEEGLEYQQGAQLAVDLLTHMLGESPDPMISARRVPATDLDELEGDGRR